MRLLTASITKDFSASRGQREGCECRVEPHLRYSFFDLADWMETLPGPFRI